MTSDEKYRLGIACSTILGDDNFKFVVSKVREDLINAWMQSDLDDDASQKLSKMTMQGLDLLMTKLVSYRDGAKLVTMEEDRKKLAIDRAQSREDERNRKLVELGIKR